MTHRLTTLTAIGLAAMAGAASAQDFDYLNFGVSFEQYDDSGDTLSLTLLNGEAGGMVGPLYFFASGDRLAFDTEFSDEVLHGHSIGASYGIAPGFALGAAYGGLGSDSSSGHFWEVFARYENGPFFGNLSYAEGDDGGLLFSESLTIATVGYGIAPGTDVALSVMHDDDDTLFLADLHYDGPAFEIDAAYFTVEGEDFNLINLGGSYSLTPTFDIVFDYSNISDGPDFTFFEIGAAYRVSDALRVSATYNRLEGSGDSADGFGIALHYDMGGRSLREETTYDRVHQTLLFDGFPIF